ncbi:MAG TPA: hypothetical protein VIV61_01845 [Candidatus Ozemobacteraceae bacterium]
MRFFTKVLFALVCSFALVISLTGCDLFGGDDDNDASGTGAVTIQGNVVDTGNVKIDGAQLTTGDVTTTSAGGAFTLTNVAVPSDGIVKITISRNGSLTTYAFEPVTGGQTLVATYTLKTLAAGSVHRNVDMTVAQTLQDDGRPDTKKAKVEFAANSILGADGTPVTSANITIANQVPGDAGYADTFPGVFAGVRNNNTTTPFESFGFVNVDLGAGNRLDPTKPATLTIPIGAGNVPTNDTIPLWSFDPATGKWKEEGVATRQVVGGNVVYVGQVTHFTFYNLDRPFTGGSFVVKVASGSEFVSGARVTITSTSSRDTTGGVWQDIKFTGSDGKVTFMVPAGSLDVLAEKDGKQAWGYMYDQTGMGASMTVDMAGFHHHEFWNKR